MGFFLIFLVRASFLRSGSLWITTWRQRRWLLHVHLKWTTFMVLAWFNHKTGAEDVHFTSVLSDSDSDAEAEPEPTTPGSGDDTLVETPKAATKRRSKLNASVDDSPKLKEATEKLDESIPNGDESPKPKESIKKRGKFPPAAAESPKPKGLVKKRGELPPTAAESPKPKDSIMKRGKLPPTVAESPKPKGSIKKRGKLPPAAAESPKPKESIKKRAKSAPTVVESPKPEEATKERGKPAPTAADSPKPNEATYKRRGKSVPVEQEEVPTKEGGDSDPIVKEEHAEEDNVEEDANWEGSSDVLEMIMVKDVAKGSEIYNTYGSLSNAGLLHRYGFTEPDNPFDIINVDLALVIDVCGRISSTRHVRRCLALWRKAGCAPCSSQGAEYFEFSVDGKPQAELLVLLYLIHAPEATQDKVEKQARDWNADEVELSDDEEIERVSSAAVYKLAKVLGWTSKLQKKSNSRKRSRDGLASSLLEGTTPNGNNKRMTPQRSSVAPREEDPNPSWLTDFDKWLLTKLVSTSLLAVVTERDSIYPEVSTMSSEKLAGGPPRSTLEEDVAFLKTVDSKTDPKLYHALFLRISERTILKKCATLMKIKSKKR
ncbi:hypothetical protein KC19_1G284400 [Ceratodon purpureus]|uniref:SET domain-containing protein n=1 Tax=Ceratodon purpureus TaxID=3225 RepID=A0A8T0JC16_CERPU|nr:hypothetical protein KC19_1G284400 [Ceratodon purpureus]